VAVASAGPYASLHLAPDRQPRQYYTTQSFLQVGCPSCRPTNSVKALKANLTIDVKKTFLRFFLFWSRYYVFYFPNVFIFKKRWQSSEREADKLEALSK